MPKYEIEYRVVEIHTYRVEAENSEEAVDKTKWWNIEPVEVDTICAEPERIREMSPVEQAQELLAEIKEDVQQLKTELTDAEYYKLRGENADWLSGKANIGTEK